MDLAQWRPVVFCLSLAMMMSTETLAAGVRIVVSEATYTMADGDTLSTAEEKVLLRAKRKAIEEAGVYLESTFLDSERKHKDGPPAPLPWKFARSQQPSQRQKSLNHADHSKMTDPHFSSELGLRSI